MWLSHVTATVDRCLTEEGDRGRHAHLPRCLASRSARKAHKASARKGAGLGAKGREAEFKEVSKEPLAVVCSYNALTDYD